jgi:hypothetical protein
MWKRTIIILAALLAVGCQSKNVVTDYDTGADFSQLQRYQWQDEPNNIDPQFQSLLSGRVKAALEQSLAAQFTPADTTHQPDFLVRYFARPVQKVVDDRPKAGIGIGGFGGNVGGGISLSFPLGGNKFDQQAEIVVDFLSPADQKLLWRGSQVVALSSSQPEANTQQVQKAVDEILRQFPPQ